MEKRNLYTISFHLLFWVLYGTVFYLVSKAYGIGDTFPYHLITTVATQIFLVYFITYPIYHWYFEKGKQGSFYGLSLALIVYLIPIVRLAIMLLNRINVTFSRWVTTDLLIVYLITFALVFISVSIKIISDKERVKRELRVLEMKKKEMELFALKNQIDSHFLFNTLNNLYGLALRKSALAPKGIMLLSELLSFVLYETKNDFYLLTKEVKLINNYFELEKLRWGNDIDIHFDISGNINECFISPLILFTFVENSFKHGIAKTPVKPWIKIKLASGVREIFFEVENSIPGFSSGQHNQSKEGIGLENIRRRLDLLYPNMHYMATKLKEKSFYVALTLTHN